MTYKDLTISNYILNLDTVILNWVKRFFLKRKSLKVSAFYSTASALECGKNNHKNDNCISIPHILYKKKQHSLFSSS